jgi:hypothetical protein
MRKRLIARQLQGQPAKAKLSVLGAQNMVGILATDGDASTFEIRKLILLPWSRQFVLLMFVRRIQ